jgi:hypothetical protein
MPLLDRLRRRTSATRTESQGLASALEIVAASKGRSFKVRGRGIRASHVPDEEVTRFIREELPDYYTYTTKVETYADRRGVRQAHLEIKGSIGLSRQMNLYNPPDVTFTIKTEAPRST